MILLFLIIIIFGADMLTKEIVLKKVPEGSRIEVIKDKIYITNIKNEGGAFGLLKENKPLLMILSILSMISIAREIIRLDRREGVPYAFMLGGGLANVYERVSRKRVTDFLLVKTKRQPVFNLADFSILFGFLILLSRCFRKKNP